MKQFVLAALLLFTALAPVAHAQVIAEASVVTDYVWRGFNVLDDNPAFQPAVTGILGETGFSANVWFSFALSDRDREAIRELDELDLTLDYEREMGPVAVNAGIFTYHLFRVDGYPDDEATFVREAYAGVALIEAPFSPWVRYNYELLDEGGNDWYLELGADHVVTFPGDQPVVLSAHAGWYSAEWAGLTGQLTDLSLTVAVPLAEERWTLTPWFMATHVPPDQVNVSDVEVHAGLSIGGVFLAR